MASANKMYSCEEVYERMEKGLCIFCDEIDIPGHHQLKHKGLQIFMKECYDDQVYEDKEEAHQIQNTVTIPEETVKNSGPFLDSIKRGSGLQVPDFVTDVLMVHKVDLHVKEVEESPQKSTSGSGKKIAHQLFDQMPNEYQEDLTVVESSNKECLSFSHKDDRVWEPGGLPTKMDHWDKLEKELKPYGESHKVETFLYSQMQMVKSNPAEFKTFDRKRSNKTLSLENEQEDEYEQNQVIKLISSWKNRIWEPGGVLIEHDRWKELEKCYNRGRLMRLMHWMSSMWWKETKSREFNRLSVACSCVDIKTWHCVKHETQQTDFHVWHRWKNKAEKLSANYALLELMVLGLVSFQPNKGTGVVGLIPKAVVLREFSHCRSNDYGTIRHKLFMVRDTPSDGCKEDSWSCIWLILKELCSAGFERKKETIKKNFNELSKLEKDHELLSPVKLEVHILYLFRKGGFIEFSGCHNHLKKLRAVLERFSQQVIDELAKRIVIEQKSNSGLKYGDVKFHLKHKWRSKLLHAPSELEVFVEDVVLFTSPDKLFFTKNHKLLHPETGFCTRYNDLELLNTEYQTSPGLDYFAWLNFIWKQVLNCGCEAVHVSSRIFSIGGVHGFEAQRKRLLVSNEIPLLENHNKVDLTIEENWFYKKPMIIEVFHLQRPPELIDIQGNPNFITKILVQWKEHPPDQFLSSFYEQVLMLSSLRTRMF